jgi:hypothetical protein
MIGVELDSSDLKTLVFLFVLVYSVYFEISFVSAEFFTSIHVVKKFL